MRAGLIPALRNGALPGSAAWRSTVVTPPDLLTSPLAGNDVVVLDQAEELFTVLQPEERTAGTDRLLDGIGHGGRVVLVLRADYYGRLVELPGLAGRIGAATVLVGAPSEEELRRLICEPARRMGLRVEPELADQVLADVAGQPGALPLVSAALVRTWRNREGSTLTVDGYVAGGGVSGALEATAEEAYLALDAPSRLAARRLLIRLATVQAGVWSRRPIARQPSDETSGGADEVTIGMLSDRRIVTVSATRIELVHDALLDGWPRLRDWLAERSAVASVVEHLSAVSQAWETAGRPDTDLYRGARLQAALDWSAAYADDVLPVEAAFIAASETAAQAELTAAREAARVQRRGRRRLRFVAIGLAAVSVLAVTGFVVSVRERASADRAALAADSSKVSALSLSAPDLRTSLLLSVAGYRLRDSVDSRSALLAALEKNASALWRIPAAGRVLFLAASRDGTQLWVMTRDRTVYRYNTITRTVLNTFPARADSVAALSPDSTQLVVDGPSEFHDQAGTGRISVLNADTGAVLRILPVTTTENDTGSPAVFTGDGRWLAVVRAGPARNQTLPIELSTSPTIAIFDTHDYTRPPRLITMPGPVTELAAGRQVLATVTADGTITVLRAADAHVLEHAHRSDLSQAGAANPTLFPLALSPDGRDLALTAPAKPGTPLLIAASKLSAAAQPTENLGGTVLNLTFSPTGRMLAAGSDNGSLDVLRVPDGSVLSRPLTSTPGQANAITWSGDNADRGLYCAGLDAQILSIDLHTGPRLITRSGPQIPDQPESWRVNNHIITAVAPPIGKPEPQTALMVTDLGSGSSRMLRLPIPSAAAVEAVSIDDPATRALAEVLDSGNVIRTNVIDLTTGTTIARFTATPEPTQYNSYVGVISHDGATATFAIGRHRLGVFALPSGRLERAFDIHFTGPAADRHVVFPLGYAPDGRVLVLGFDTPAPAAAPGASPGPPADPTPENQLLGIVNLATGHLDGQVGLGVFGVVDAQDWSADGRRLVVGTYAGTIKVVDARSLAPISDTVRAVAGVVQTVSFSPDASTVVSGGTDGTLSFWDAATLRLIGSPVRSELEDSWWAWYTTHGDIAGYAPSDTPGHEQWFTMPAQPQQWATAACTLADSQLTTAEWNRYIGTHRQYRTVC